MLHKAIDVCLAARPAVPKKWPCTFRGLFVGMTLRMGVSFSPLEAPQKLEPQGGGLHIATGPLAILVDRAPNAAKSQGEEPSQAPEPCSEATRSDGAQIAQLLLRSQRSNEQASWCWDVDQEIDRFCWLAKGIY